MRAGVSLDETASPNEKKEEVISAAAAAAKN